MKTNRQLLVMVASALAAGFGYACSSSSGSPASGGGTDAGHDSAMAAMDSGADVGSAMDAPADTHVVDDAGCIVINNGAAVVTEQNVASDEPTPTGTSIPDGTYYVTAESLYVGDGGTAGPTTSTVQFTSHVSGMTYEAIESINGGSGQVSNGTLTTNGSSVVIQQTCPATDAGPSTLDMFSSDGTTVTVYTSSPPFMSFTFTKQP